MPPIYWPFRVEPVTRPRPESASCGHGHHIPRVSPMSRSRIFFRSVLRLSPNMTAARSWLPRVASRASAINDRSTSRNTRRCRPGPGSPGAWASKYRTRCASTARDRLSRSPDGDTPEPSSAVFDRTEQALPIAGARHMAGADRKLQGRGFAKHDDRHNGLRCRHGVGDPCARARQHRRIDRRGIAGAGGQNVAERIRGRREQERKPRLVQEPLDLAVRARQHDNPAAHAAKASPPARPKKRMIALCTSLGSAIALTVERNAAPPRQDLAYHARCLRAMRTPVTGP